MKYEKTNEKIEQFTELFANAMAVTAIVFVLPSFIYTMVNYYLLDSGEESFLLLFPSWFVL